MARRIRATPDRGRAGPGFRNLRRQPSIRAARLHCTSLERSRAAAGCYTDQRGRRDHLINQETPKLLARQKALVTGANSGIGKAVAIALCQAGADVVVNYVTGDDAAQEVAQTAASNGGRAIAIKADISQEDQVQLMFRKIIDEFGTIDILVNNAGLQRDAAI